MKQQLDHLAVLQACYRQHETHEQWLSDVLDVVVPLFERGHGFGFSMQRDGGDHPIPLLTGYRGMPNDPRKVTATATKLDGASYRTLWYPPRPITFISELLPKLATPSRPVMDEYVDESGVADMLGVTGYPTRDIAFVMWSGLSARIELSGRLRDVLQRVRLHVETALRLRLLGPSQAVALLHPTGRVVHMEARQGAALSPKRISQSAREIEALRVPRHRRTAQDALVVWQALVDGHWSLVEHFDTDGKRFYCAFENPPQAIAHRALSPRESAVVDLYAKGLTGKYVAHALGLSETTISQVLLTAAARLGFRSRLELVRFAAWHLRHGQRYDVSLLTDAEREVLLMIKAEMSNRAIATARRCSERTVANQVASILRKTGAPGRKALATID